MATVLLVEDNELNRDMLSRRLQRQGFNLLIAVDGLAGVAAVQAHRPDLVLMDMSLPGIDGWEATRRLKADPATRAIPVIALTAHAMADDRASAMAAGCDEFDTKPVDMDRLLAKMRRLLGSPAPGAQPEPPGAASARAIPEAGLARPAVAEADLTRPAVPGSLPEFQAELERFCQAAAVPDDMRHDLQVVLDEVCANVCHHAYPPGRPGALTLQLRHLAAWPASPTQADAAPPEPSAIELVFRDQGQPFDPLAAAAPDLASAWDERPLGGLGLHLIRQMTDRQSYRHSAAEGNQLTLLKHLP